LAYIHEYDVFVVADDNINSSSRSRNEWRQWVIFLGRGQCFDTVYRVPWKICATYLFIYLNMHEQQTYTKHTIKHT